MYMAFWRLIGAVSLYYWMFNCIKKNPLLIGVGLISVLVCTILLSYFYKKCKLRKERSALSNQLKQLKNSDLVAFRKNLSLLSDIHITKIYKKECLHRFGFIYKEPVEETLKNKKLEPLPSVSFENQDTF